MSDMGTDPEQPVAGADTFQVTGQKYDDFMGRYSKPLASGFVDAAGVRPGMTALDLGCGPGALTTVLVERLGAASVSACDPSRPFVTECAARHPGTTVRVGRAEAIPFEDDAFDCLLAQLVLHFVGDTAAAAGEMLRVLRPGGTAGACVWGSMQLLDHFWTAAISVDPTAAANAVRELKLSQEGDLGALFAAAGFTDVTETTVDVSSTYVGFDQLWSGFLAGIGPAGAYCLSLDPDTRTDLRSATFHEMGSPSGPITLDAVARCGSGRTPR
ncbi:MAG: methyltransferase domain-containing protein [Actinomycetota bacterium]|nr:methyltransferase domain-containing protein [Actinomycetota bacterium]